MDSSQEETQHGFVSQDDDELWDVERITAERRGRSGKEYRVVWKGVDPKTGKPWPQSWVPRQDCTDDLVAEWKRASKAGKKVSRKSKVKPQASRSSTPSSSRRSATVATTTKVKDERLSSVVPPSISAARSPSVQPTGTKRKRHADQSAHSSAKHSDVVPPGGTEVVFASPRKATSRKHNRQEEEEEGEENESRPPPPKAIQPRKKRKVQVEIDTPPPRNEKTRLTRALELQPSRGPQPPAPPRKSSPIEAFSQSFEEVEKGLRTSEPETDDEDETRQSARPSRPSTRPKAKPTSPERSTSPPSLPLHPIPIQLPPNVKIGPPARTKSHSRISIVGGSPKKANGVKKTKSVSSVVSDDKGSKSRLEKPKGCSRQSEDHSPPPVATLSGKATPESDIDGEPLPPEPPLDAYATTDPGFDDDVPMLQHTDNHEPTRTSSLPVMEWSKTKATLASPRPSPADKDPHPEPPVPPQRKPLVEVEPLDLSQSQSLASPERNDLAPPVQTRPAGRSPSLQEAARSAFRAVVEKPMGVFSIFWEGKKSANVVTPEVSVQRVEEQEQVQVAAGSSKGLKTVEALMKEAREEAGDDPESRLSPAAVRRLKKWEKDIVVIEQWERKKQEKENEGRRRGKGVNGKEVVHGVGKRKERAKDPEPVKVHEEIVDTSYSGEIVPETQSQPMRENSPTPPPPPPPPAPEPHALTLAMIPPPPNNVPVPQTPGSLHRHDSLRARMKPRTPGSSSRPLSRAETAPSALLAPPVPKFNLMVNALPPLPDDDDDDDQGIVDDTMANEVDSSQSKSVSTAEAVHGSASQPREDGALAAAAATTTTTTLRPAPLIAPGDFSPYLNLDAPSDVGDVLEEVVVQKDKGKGQEGVSSLETARDSIVDPDGSFAEGAVRKSKGKRRPGDGEDDDAHMSSIEEFESPRKTRSGGRTTIIQAVSHVQLAKPPMKGILPGTKASTEDTDFLARRMEIAERAKREAQAALMKEQGQKEETRGRRRLPVGGGQSRRYLLDRVVADRARSKSEEVAKLSGDEGDALDVLSQRMSSPDAEEKEKGRRGRGSGRCAVVPPVDEDEESGYGHMTMDDLAKAFEGGEDLEPSDDDRPADADDAAELAPAKSTPRSVPCPPSVPPPAAAAESATATDADMTYPSMTMDDIMAAYNQPGDAIDPMMLREEEEETTQDVFATKADSVPPTDPQQEGAKQPQPLPTVLEEPDGAEDAMDVDVKAPSTSGSDGGRSAIPEIVIEDASRAPSMSISPTTTDGARPPPSRRARSTRSRSNTPAPAPPAPPPPARRLRSQSRELDPVPSKVNKGKGKAQPSEHLSSLLTAKSEEVARLDAQLEALRADFQTQLSALSTRLSEAESSKSQLSEQLEQAALEAQKRTTELEAAKKAKTSAENDKEFIREQYLRSSAYVSDIRDENKALELRASVAESQVSTGLEMVKATYEKRLKVLEADVKSWRRMAEFLMEKDKRTDDDIRKRAAEEPELRRKVKRVKLELEAAKNEIDMLSHSLDTREEQLQGAMEDVARGKREKVELLVALEEAEDKLRRLGMGGTASQESGGSDGHEFVYRCKWRMEDGQSCPQVFSTIGALQQHLYEGHLPS